MNWLHQMGIARSAITDEQAMWRVQTRDDHEAFAELVRRWEMPIRRLCTRMTGDSHIGEDLAQETFARVFNRRHAYGQGRKFSTWLWRIALNLCHDEHRRAERRVGSFLDTDLTHDNPVASDRPGPDEQLLSSERGELVRAALQQLPESHRVVVALREYEGLKLREIAEVLEIPEGTVKSRLADALTRLAQLLKVPLDEEWPVRPDLRVTAKK